MTYTVEITYKDGQTIQKDFSGHLSLVSAREFLNKKKKDAKLLDISTSKIKQAYSLYTN